MEDSLRSLMCLKCCPKCGGAMFRECDIYGCDIECLQCGYVMRKEALEALVGPERAEKLLQLGMKRLRESEPEEPPKRGRPRKSEAKSHSESATE
jgi:DNA-directed RNA polymerase subunit M/transcription elongation factor TFIIS